MLTFRAGKLAALAISLACLAACSREQQDWRSAEATDTVEGYARFLKQHPDSELVTAARGRFAQLSEDREWSQAGATDTADAYKQFLARYPNGKWAQEARIRIENFSLGAEGSAAPAVTAAANAVAPPVSPPSVAQPYIEGPTHAPTTAATTPSATAPLVAGEAAQIPTSPAPPTYPQSAATQQTPSAISTAWRSADSVGPTAYGVQLGAFASENAATSEWDQLTARFSPQLRGLVPHVVSADTTTGRLFRLQALVADEATARALCDMLRKQSQACVPVLPH